MVSFKISSFKFQIHSDPFRILFGYSKLHSDYPLTSCGRKWFGQIFWLKTSILHCCSTIVIAPKCLVAFQRRVRSSTTSQCFPPLAVNERLWWKLFIEKKLICNQYFRATYSACFCWLIFLKSTRPALLVNFCNRSLLFGQSLAYKSVEHALPLPPSPNTSALHLLPWIVPITPRYLPSLECPRANKKRAPPYELHFNSFEVQNLNPNCFQCLKLKLSISDQTGTWPESNCLTICRCRIACKFLPLKPFNKTFQLRAPFKGVLYAHNAPLFSVRKKTYKTNSSRIVDR